MFEKIKGFYEDHETVIKFVGFGVLSAATVGLAGYGVYRMKNSMDLAYKDWVEKAINRSNILEGQVQKFNNHFKIEDTGMEWPIVSKEQVMDIVQLGGDKTNFQVSLLDENAVEIFLSVSEGSFMDFIDEAVLPE